MLTFEKKTSFKRSLDKLIKQPRLNEEVEYFSLKELARQVHYDYTELRHLLRTQQQPCVLLPACILAGRLGYKPLWKELLLALCNTTLTEECRRAAGVAIGRLGAKRSANALAKITTSNIDEMGRLIATQALAFVGGTTAESCLQECVVAHDVSTVVRIAAADGLGFIGSPESARFLRVAIEDSDPCLRLSGIYALGECGEPSDIAILERFFEVDEFCDVPGDLPAMAAESIRAIRRRFRID
jgi:HEAT repeat protein